MQKPFRVLGILILSLIFSTNIIAQKKEKTIGSGERVIIELKNGEKHSGIIDELILKRNISIWEEPHKKRQIYSLQDISQIMLLPADDRDTIYYVSKPLIKGRWSNLLNKPKDNFLLKVEYSGNKITLYSIFEKTTEVTTSSGSNGTRSGGYASTYRNMHYYAQVGTDSTIRRISSVSLDYFPKNHMRQFNHFRQRANIQSSINLLENYPELAKRIKDDEFDLSVYSPINIVKEWENMYAVGNRQVDQKAINEYKHSRRYRNPAFTYAQNNISLSLSPAYSPIFLNHYGLEAKDVKVKIPAISFNSEICFAQYSNTSALGSFVQIEAGKNELTYKDYSYYMNPEIHNPYTHHNPFILQEVSITESSYLFSFTLGLSYHYTLLKDLEIYSKAAFGYAYFSNTEHLNRSDSFFKNLIYPISVGSRYYFNRSLGVFVEGGYLTTGYCSIGLSLRMQK